ncbi:MAG: lysophospholipid acyltransferase family protein [Pigmentiphaga sp.]|uniref:lysophospholipid acyltransferase family protein n=1 Tax=Pigmentiphaga sp. TaxID=1977564 RepID=UPI0029BD7FF5|nr:lysophospholipid acyltransferase family protein [Pigmentiphaga sp.]MDX3904535.1 lysophospholipid acyltransferase family protein [Pigmentiphaga sp.]
MRWLRSLLFSIFFISTMVPYAIACVLWLPLPLHWRYRLTQGWPRLIVWGARWIVGIRWQTKGWENLPDRPVIVLSKHQSTWETLFLAGWLPHEICYVYKRELNWVPFFGWGLAGLRMIAIDRKKGSDAFEQVVAQGRERLADGRWLVMFPEGTRIAPGKKGKYKSGGARLAVRTGAWVVPIAHNAGECWPRKTFIKRPGLITISVGQPIDPQGLTADQINRRVEDWIENEMRQLNPERYPDTRSAERAAS